MPLSVHIVSHTHWDREWYQPAGRFRQRLVALVDELLDDPPPPGESFLLDGQAIVIDDYLAVRPERRAELSSLLRQERLEAGPWYVLADELIPSGEALVRNLLAGRRLLRAMRAESPAVLYCPDSFGHPAMLPLLARGFGFAAVIAWRGYGGPRWPEGDAAWWSSPDGCRVLLIHLPPDGYELGSNLPADHEAAAGRWGLLRDVLAPRSRLGVVLVHNGADHHARQLNHRAAVEALAAAARPDSARASSLGAFVAESLQRAGEASLPAVSGELRDSYGYTWTLQGTFATRAAQKRTNARVERLLVRDAEPWAAMVRARGGASRRALGDATWRVLLECHPHDTLCGCSIDAVARAADARWDDAAAQGQGLRDDALLELAGHDPAAAHTRRDAWRPAVLIRNRAARARGGIVHLRLETFLADVGVGPASGGREVRLPESLEPSTGLAMPHQVLASCIENRRIESPRHYPDNDLVAVRDVVAWISDVPGYGMRTQLLDAGDAGTVSTESGGADAPCAPARASERRLENGVVGIDVHGLLDVECRHDGGDLYTPSIGAGGPPAEMIAPRVVHDGPLHAAWACDWRVPPAGGGSPTSMTTTVSLGAGETFFRIAIRGDHQGRDQRIRLLIRTGVRHPTAWADAAFGPVRRLPLEVGDAEAARESPPRTAPLHRYVSVFGMERGATVYSDGLAEYEVLDDGTVAITLVRAVGELSRSDLPERPGHAGWPSPAPEAQSQGPFGAELAVLFHGPHRDAATIDAIERTADDVLLPLVGDTLRSALTLPDSVAGVTLEGRGLAFSALKESEDGAWTVVRCLSLLEAPVHGTWTFGWPVSEAYHARLDETLLKRVEVAGNSVAFVAGPRAVVTLLVR